MDILEAKHWNARQSSLSLGGVERVTGTDCPRGGNTAPHLVWS